MPVNIPSPRTGRHTLPGPCIVTQQQHREAKAKCRNVLASSNIRPQGHPGLPQHAKDDCTMHSRKQTSNAAGASGVSVSGQDAFVFSNSTCWTLLEAMIDGVS